MTNQLGVAFWTVLFGGDVSFSMLIVAPEHHTIQSGCGGFVNCSMPSNCQRAGARGGCLRTATAS